MAALAAIRPGPAPTTARAGHPHPGQGRQRGGMGITRDGYQFGAPHHQRKQPACSMAHGKVGRTFQHLDQMHRRLGAMREKTGDNPVPVVCQKRVCQGNGAVTYIVAHYGHLCSGHGGTRAMPVTYP